MAELHLARPAACPVRQAPVFLESFFQGASVEGGPSLVALRAPVTLPGLPEMTLTRDCVVRISVAAGAQAPAARYDVVWESAAGGPFPRFVGILTVTDDDAGGTLVALDGDYEPPLGPLGIAFDTVIGHAIAESTGKDLLDRIARHLARSQRSVETARANRRRATTT